MKFLKTKKISKCSIFYKDCADYVPGRLKNE